MFKKGVRTGIFALFLVPAIVVWFSYRADTKNPESEDVHAVHDSQSGDADSDTPKDRKRKIKYWVAPMDPNYIRNEPGKSPMGMDLVPVYEDEDEKSSEGVIMIDPVTVQNIGVRTAAVSRGQLRKSIRAVGRITYDEKRVEHIHTKVSGWVEELYVDTTGENVLKGSELLSFYSPELVATQEEFVQALKYRDSTSASHFTDVAEGGRSLVESARKRLQFMDIDSRQIEALEKSREVQRNVKLYATKSGVVIHKNVVDGMKVDPMMELYTIADLSRVWVIASVYEYELPFIETGQEAEMTLSYDPGALYKGRVTFIYPYLSAKTRTVDVRIEFNNPGMKLKPDMYADVVIKARPAPAEILVPSEAVIRTGARSVVITSLGKGKFLPREVTVGSEGEGLVQILKGLKENETVVTSGQFLIDSESNLREAVSKMLEAQTQKTGQRQQNREPTTRTEQKKAPVPELTLSDDQKNGVSELIDRYVQIHEALVSESGTAVAEKTHEMHSVLEKIKASDTKGTMKEITDSIEPSLEGLHSGDLQAARTSFKTLSRIMTELIKGIARDEAVAAGIKIYFCPMESEPWIQKGTELRNPYLGKDMWVCGTEEKY